MANDISFFFYNKIENIRRELDVVEIDQEERENVIADSVFTAEKKIHVFLGQRRHEILEGGLMNL